MGQSFTLGVGLRVACVIFDGRLVEKQRISKHQPAHTQPTCMPCTRVFPNVITQFSACNATHPASLSHHNQTKTKQNKKEKKKKSSHTLSKVARNATLKHVQHEMYSKIRTWSASVCVNVCECVCVCVCV